MAITAQLVKQLRDRTGAGMMDCKKALVETDGDLEKAIEYLQVKGIMKAAKKSDRVAAEGLVATVVTDGGSSATVIEVNSETDFVARNETFQAFVTDLAAVIAESNANTVEEALELSWKGQTVDKVMQETIATIGENIRLRRFVRFTQPEGFVASYTHAGAQIGVLVNVRTDSVTDERKEFGRDIAMHIAAMKPEVLTADDLDPAVVAKQEEIYAQQVAEEGKPANLVPKIVAGKISKWKVDQALLTQAFVKDSDLTVDGFQKKVGGVQIVEFARIEVGAGIEKQEADLAGEVAATLRG